MYILEHWMVVDDLEAADLTEVRLKGVVFGNPKFRGGEFIRTSPIKRYVAERDSVLTRSGSEYLLGKVDPDFARLGPFVKQRLIRFLQEAEARERQAGRAARDPETETAVQIRYDAAAGATAATSRDEGAAAPAPLQG